MKVQAINLTKNEAAVLLAIGAHFDRHGFGPTLRELVACTGVSSTSHAGFVLKRLEAKGLIARTRHIGRGLALTPEGRGWIWRARQAQSQLQRADEPMGV